jgi:sugar-specific transcriptional regulator TrmB
LVCILIPLCDILQLMSDQTDNLTTLLEPFGLTTEEAQIYLVMLEYGKLSALEISRKLLMGRTKVYRILDKLISYELAVNEYDEIGFKFVASPPEKLSLLIARQEGEVAALKQSLPSIQDKLLQISGGGQPGSKVLYYRGIRGLSQVNFNLLKAKDYFCSFEVSNAEAYMEHEEAEQLRRELVANKITARTITNQTQIEPFTAVTDLVRNYWEIRYIDPKKFEIKADVFIYNDVYAVCHYLEDKDVFCVEMYNQVLATMQQQLFEYVWAQAKPLTVVNDRGEAKLVDV